MDNNLPSEDSFNRPRAALADLIALLVLADRRGLIQNAIHTEGLDTAYAQALEDAVEVIGEAGIDHITRRYEIEPAELRALADDKPAEGKSSLGMLEIAHCNLAHREPDEAVRKTVMDWVQAEATYAHTQMADDFVINLGCSMSDIPAALIDVIKEARMQGCGYLNVYSD